MWLISTIRLCYRPRHFTGGLPLRYAHDHPRSWTDFLFTLDAADSTALRSFAMTHGVVAELAPTGVLEDIFEAWCASGAESSPLGYH